MEELDQAHEMFNKFWAEGLSDRQAKECALIAVRYIINANPHSNPLNTEGYQTSKYWQLVQKHLMSF